MPTLLLVLLFLACESRPLDSRVDLRNEEANPVTPAQTPNSVDDSCKTSCAACSAWQWGDWSPATDTVCTGQALTQKRQGTRTCKGLCVQTKCMLNDTKEREQQGTKTCTDPPPACKTSCVEACGSWDDATWTELTPKPDSECEGKPFTQTQEAKRTCSGLCADIDCEPSKKKEKDAVGMKETPCDQHCTVAWGDWNTEAKDVCKGVSFQQTKKGKRTCTGLCAGTSCPEQVSETKPAVGTKETTCDAGCTWGAWQVKAGEKQASEVCAGTTFKQKQARTRTCTDACVDQTTCSMQEEQTIDTNGTKDCSVTTNEGTDDATPDTEPPDTAEVAGTDDTTKDTADTNTEPPTAHAAADETCATACQAWGTWSNWSPPPASCDLTSLKSSGNYTQQRSRSRTCDTTNLQAGENCPTTNSEKMEGVPCPFCQGEGQIPVADGTCDCSGVQGYYQENENATSCTECKTPKIMKKVGEVWQCNEPDCDCEDKSICTDWSEKQVQAGSQEVSEVCRDEKFSQTLERTRTCTAVNCVGIDKCKQLETETIEAVGKKETPCDTTCDNWSKWSDWLPATAPENCADKFTQKRSRTRNCAKACAYAKCEDKQEETQRVDCPVASAAVIIPVSACDCDNKSICGEWSGWQLQTGSQEASVVCRDEEFSQTLEQTRTCTAINCVGIDNCKQHDTKTVEAIGKKETPCADNCDAWNAWSAWSPTLSSTCPVDTSFEPHVFEQTRNRERQCQGLCSYIKCPTNNSETIQTSCSYCKGTGQIKLDQPDAEGRTCVCDSDKSYYRKAGEDKCTHCPYGIDADGQSCASMPTTATIASTNNNCPQNKQNKYYHVGGLGCECDESRDFIPGWPEGQLTDRQGECVCRNNYYEVPDGFSLENYDNTSQINQSTSRDEDTYCKQCATGRNLRQISSTANWKWGCVTCDLADMLKNTDLGHPDKIGQGKVGKECYCSTEKAVKDAIDEATDAKLDSVLYNYHSVLKDWFASKRPLNGYADCGLSSFPVHGVGSYDDRYSQWDSSTYSKKDFLKAFWNWYLEVIRRAHTYGDRCYPPLIGGSTWEDYYDNKKPSGFSGPADLKTKPATNLRFINCTVADMLK